MYEFPIHTGTTSLIMDNSAHEERSLNPEPIPEIASVASSFQFSPQTLLGVSLSVAVLLVGSALQALSIHTDL